MDEKLLILYEHRDLLRYLGYEIDLPIIDLLVKDTDAYKKSVITKNNKTVGEIGLEERNMYYLFNKRWLRKILYRFTKFNESIQEFKRRNIQNENIRWNISIHRKKWRKRRIY